VKSAGPAGKGGLRPARRFARPVRRVGADRLRPL